MKNLSEELKNILTRRQVYLLIPHYFHIQGSNPFRILQRGRKFSQDLGFYEILENIIVCRPFFNSRIQIWRVGVLFFQKIQAERYREAILQKIQEFDAQILRRLRTPNMIYIEGFLSQDFITVESEFYIINNFSLQRSQYPYIRIEIWRP